jgi:hypothetical protein
MGMAISFFGVKSSLGETVVKPMVRILPVLAELLGREMIVKTLDRFGEEL